jgi:hypothetical protein
MEMKIILDIEEIGKIAVENDTYIVFYKWFNEKRKRPLVSKYFMTLEEALLELQKHNFSKHLASYKEPAKSCGEFLKKNRRI